MEITSGEMPISAIINDWIGNAVAGKIGTIHAYIKEGKNDFDTKDIFKINTITESSQYNQAWLESFYGVKNFNELEEKFPEFQTYLKTADDLAAELNVKLENIERMIRDKEPREDILRAIEETKYGTLRFNEQTKEFFYVSAEEERERERKAYREGFLRQLRDAA